MSLSEKLTALRKEHGYSQLYVAEHLNVSRQAISRWEVGSSVPSTQNLLELSQLYGVPLDTLVGRDAEEKNPPTPDSQTVSQGHVPEPKNSDVPNSPKKKLYIALVTLCIVLLCLLISCLWYIVRIHEDENAPIRYEDMENAGPLIPDGTFDFE